MAIQEQELQHTYHSIVDNLQSLRENLTNLQLKSEIQYENEELQQTFNEGKNLLNNLIKSEFYLNTLNSFKKLQISQPPSSTSSSSSSILPSSSTLSSSSSTLPSLPSLSTSSLPSSFSRRKQEINTNLKLLSPAKKQKRHESYNTF